MKSINLFDRRVGFAFVAAVMLVATLVTIVVSAAQLTQRSIELSSSSVRAQNVTYKVNFTSPTEAEAFVVDFCSNSPIMGQACTPAAGFSVGAPASATPGFTTVAALGTKAVVVTGDITVNQNVSVAISGITNPTASGPLYARIATFDTAENAALYTSTTPGTGKVDDGGAAISITDTIGVSGAVLETMTFCVSGTEITTENCAGSTSPVLKLGEPIDGDDQNVALSAGEVSTGDLHTLISTNAVTGAVVSLKSSALGCGGLKRANAPAACDIAPALKTGIAEGEAKFGVMTSPSTDLEAGVSDGIYQAYLGSGYNDATYALNFAENDATGVTSVFGDLFLDTGGLPANGKKMKLTFGASIGNNTPAGLYSTDLSLIATGRF